MFAAISYDSVLPSIAKLTELLINITDQENNCQCLHSAIILVSISELVSHFSRCLRATSFSDWGSYDCDQIRVSLCLLCLVV